MPTYEYACTACAEHIEVVQSFTDSSLTECPSCGGRLRKVFSPVGVVFKGSGFYKTDSRSSSSSSTKTDASSKSDSSTSGETKTTADSTTPAKSDSAKTGSTTPAAKPAATSTTA